ncbi:Hsp70 escorting protein 2 [Monoraphidium neglectum]|uniref:Hsp70 escorting protein 2 n=1 Tax=Monoraphidium neglectum TaxID=145388 RepID=A0A0D2KRL8_9CHLO|nr:Hsp70 escorting protein 2 [Monoraphidium neglectum]KIY98188.1 Hsp70 escorting protein 2 [Monoraphidium neglectum]|eukprot:XP_013897208.1 Hsp70 escorting protein 2 [Monoraphidium neglectum]
MDAAARERTNASAEAALGFRQQLLPLLLPPRAACGGILATHGGTNSGPSHFRQKNTAGLRLEPASDENQTDVEYDEASKTVRIPLSAMDGGRRTKLVMFTCNKCGGRTARLTNPVAWERGAVFCQCQHCQVWHTLAASKSVVEEVRYDDPEGQRRRRQELLEAALREQEAEAVAAGTTSDDSLASADTAADAALAGDGGGDSAESGEPLGRQR